MEKEKYKKSKEELEQVLQKLEQQQKVRHHHYHSHRHRDHRRSREVYLETSDVRSSGMYSDSSFLYAEKKSVKEEPHANDQTEPEVRLVEHKDETHTEGRSRYLSKSSYAEKEKENRKKEKLRWKVIFGSVLAVVLCLCLVVSGTAIYMLQRGEKELHAKGGSDMPELVAIDGVVDIENLEDGTVLYHGIKYRYNEGILSFLLTGVDTRGTIEDGNLETGQADVLLLAVLDNANKRMTMIPINRDTMTDIDVYSEEGEYMRTQVEHLALSFAYGDGGKESADLVTKAVSNLFYGLPIHGYFMVNMDAIPVLNDVAGGIEITLEEDYTDVFGSDYAKGNTVVLSGDKAEKFVRTRYAIGDGTNSSRMKQQRQYLISYIRKALEMTKKNLLFPVSVYNIISDYLLTDVGVSQVAYMASQAIQCRLPDNFLRSIKGKQADGDYYTDFYVDEKELYELILDVFYNQVDE